MAYSLYSTFGIALSSALIYVFTRAIYDIFFHPLAKVPGPLLAKVSCLWKFRAATSLKFADKLRAVHAQYGPVVRISSNEVSVISPEDVKTIYGHKSDYIKGPWYDAWKLGPLNSHFNEREPSAHAERRRLIASAYSLNHLRTLEHSVDENVEVLCKKYLDVAAGVAEGNTVTKEGEKKAVNMADLVEWFCYDSVAQMAWGKTYGLLEKGGDHTGLLEDLGAGNILVSCLACTPFGWMMATDFAQKILTYLQPDKGICLFMKQANQIVKDRLELKQRDPAEYQLNKDMLYRFVECFDSFAGKQEAFDLVANETSIVVVAGADTTLISTNAALRYIYTSPRVLAALRAEITEAIEMGKLSLPSPTYDQVANLPYLNACLKEAMRLHPAVAMPLQRIVPNVSSEDGSIGKVIAGKFYLPPGTKVGMSAWTLHMSKEAYGEDAAEFRPERWLGDDRKELEKYNLTFGMGSRVCLGKNISMMEMNKLIPVLVHNYDLEMVNPAEPYRSTQCWFTVQKDFMVKVHKREGIDH